MREKHLSAALRGQCQLRDVLLLPVHSQNHLQVRVTRVSKIAQVRAQLDFLAHTDTKLRELQGFDGHIVRERPADIEQSHPRREGQPADGLQRRTQPRVLFETHPLEIGEHHHLMVQFPGLAENRGGRLKGGRHRSHPGLGARLREDRGPAAKLLSGLRGQQTGNLPHLNDVHRRPTLEVSRNVGDRGQSAGESGVPRTPRIHGIAGVENRHQRRPGVAHQRAGAFPHRTRHEQSQKQRHGHAHQEQQELLQPEPTRAGPRHRLQKLHGPPPHGLHAMAMHQMNQQGDADRRQPRQKPEVEESHRAAPCPSREQTVMATPSSGSNTPRALRRKADLW